MSFVGNPKTPFTAFGQKQPLPNIGKVEAAYEDLLPWRENTMLSSSLFESVFNHSPIGHYLLSPTPEATILAVNDTFLKASSRRREDLVGISLFMAFPGNPDDSEDSGETALRRSLARVVETGKPDTLPAQRYPIRIELPNGEVDYEERFWDAVSTPIFGEDGRIVCISHTTTDVTEQVRYAAALRDSEKRYRALTNATAHDGAVALERQTVESTCCNGFHIGQSSGNRGLSIVIPAPSSHVRGVNA